MGSSVKGNWSSSLTCCVLEQHSILPAWINLTVLSYKACKTRKPCLWVFADLKFKFDVKKTFSFKTSIVKFLSLANWELW